MNLGQPSGIGAGAAEGVNMLFWGLLLIAAVPITILLIKRLLGHVRSRREKSLLEEMLAEAGKKEKAGEFVSAAAQYERLKMPEKAAGLYDKGRDFMRAAVIYERLDQMKKVIEMYEKAGDIERAAETCMITGDYIEAARLYRQQGDRPRTAHALELSGNRMAAIREYREAKDYVKASELLREEGMHKEAAEMYGISLTGEEPDAASLEKFYAYAVLLESAEDRGRASEVFRKIAVINPHFRDLEKRLRATEITEQPASTAPMEGPAPYTLEGPAKRETTLRSLIRSGRMEPKNSLKLWVQALRALEKNYSEGGFPDNLAPENILIDAENNVTFSAGGQKSFAYTAPESVSGGPPDEISVIYSMGLILYEMLAGGLETVRIKSLGEVMGDVPEWLDEITMKCIDKNRSGRFQNIDEIFSALAALKGRV